MKFPALIFKHSRILVCIAVFAFSEQLFSQNMKVDDFKENPMSTEARLNKKVDQNGIECALVKVMTTIDNLKFDGGDLSSSVAEVIKKTGEYWVYVSEGSRRLVIMSDDLGRYLYTFPMSIKSLNVYIMELSSNYNTPKGAKETPMQYLTITSVPDGADIFLDNKLVGTSGNFSQKLEVKEYTYRLEKHLYYPYSGLFTLNPEETNNLHKVLKPNYGFVNITTFPEEGAQVEIDNVPLQGVTPIRSDRLQSGKHSVRIKKLMYKTKADSFEIFDEKTTTLIIEMEPTFAQITVEATNNADIYIDDMRKGSSSVIERLLEGLHTFEAKKDNYRSDRKQFTVIAGQPQTFSLNPIPITGSADITSQPWGATIFLNGDSIGTTPKNLKNKIIGNYTIRLEKAGFESLTIPLTIAENQTSAINEMLSSGKGAIVEITSNPKGADLYINGEYSGSTPFQKELGVGVYEYRLEFPKYHSKKSQFQVRKQENKQLLNITLDPNFGKVSVKSVPPGADVMIDNELVGVKTPCIIDNVSSEAHSVTLQLTGYETFKKVVQVKDMQTSEIDESLIAIYSNVKVISEKDAMIYVDGELKGVSNWGGQLIAGRHYFTALMKNHYPDTVKVELIARQDRTIELHPKPIVGKLQIRTVPDNVDIEIRDLPAGKTPLNLIKLPIGTYTVKAEYKRYPPIKGFFEIQENATTNITFTMNKDLNSQRYKALSLSLIPGIGQMYYKHGGEGILYFAATVGSLYAGYYYNNQLKTSYKKYETSFQEYVNSTDGLMKLNYLDDVNAHIKEMNGNKRSRDIYYSTAAVIWVYNLIDAYYLNRNLRYLKGKENFKFSIETYKDQFLMGVNYKF